MQASGVLKRESSENLQHVAKIWCGKLGIIYRGFAEMGFRIAYSSFDNVKFLLCPKGSVGIKWTKIFGLIGSILETSQLYPTV